MRLILSVRKKERINSNNIDFLLLLKKINERIRNGNKNAVLIYFMFNKECF